MEDSKKIIGVVPINKVNLEYALLVTKWKSRRRQKSSVARKNRAKQQCPCKFYMEQDKENVSNIQANHSEFQTGLSHTIPICYEG